MSLKDVIEEIACKSGIKAYGITGAHPFYKTEKVLKERAKEGILPEFVEDRLDRCYPRNLLGGAKSIISIAMPYNVPPDSGINYDGRGKIAWFAHGVDYHSRLLDLMNKFIEGVKSEVGNNWSFKACVDTSPIVERSVAVRAGVGWFGKNSCIINPKYGSRIVLGEILTDLVLPCNEGESTTGNLRDETGYTTGNLRDEMEDKIGSLKGEFISKCGDCSLCMDSCPTGAIERPFTVIPQKCLSHITQAKGFVPPEYRRLMGNRLYGCDICQDVCPRNDICLDGSYNKETCFTDGLDVELFAPELESFVKLSSKQFKERYKNTAFVWRGRTVLQRNAVIAMSNSKDDKYLKVLTELLNDERPVISGHAEWALAKIKNSKI